MTQCARWSIIGNKVAALRKRLVEYHALQRQVKIDKQTIRNMLSEMGYRGPMPWLAVRKQPNVVPFPSNEQSVARKASA